MYRAVGAEAAIATVHAGYDTAPAHGFGPSETRLGQAINSLPALSDKPPPFQADFDYSRDIRAALQVSPVRRFANPMFLFAQHFEHLFDRSRGKAEQAGKGFAERENEKYGRPDRESAEGQGHHGGGVEARKETEAAK